MKKRKHYKIMRLLNVSREAEIHAISKTWGNRIVILWEKYRKTQTSQSNGFLLQISREAEIHAIPMT